MKSKTYKVIEWTYTSPHTTCCFSYAEPTEAIKQAIINDIRENGYMFDRAFALSPILNTGEVVDISYELHEELIRRAYGFNEEEYARYYERVVKNPDHDLTTQSHFICEYPMRRIVWINDDAFDDFKASLLNGKSNVDIIPNDYIHLKKGDAVRYTSEDKTKYFEVKIKDFLPGTILSQISDIENLNKPDTKSIIDFMRQGKNEYIYSEPLSYRYEGLSGKEIYREFERIYGTWILKMISNGNFDCNINVIIFDKDDSFEPIVLEKPDDIPLGEDVMKTINEAYEQSMQEEKRKKEEERQKILRLKEKIAKRKKENDE